MYFESRQHHIFHVSAAEQAAKLVKALPICHAVQWGKCLFVNDEHPSGTGTLEVAVLYKDDNKYFQIESITPRGYGEKLALGLEEYHAQCETGEGFFFKKEVPFNDEQSDVWFHCGCCGQGFKSTHAHQRQFDQDAGYGICPACESYYL